MTQFFREWWTCIIFDQQSKVVEVVNPNDRLFFGKQILPGMMLKELAGKDEANQRQLQTIADGLKRTRLEKRHVYLEYLSHCPGGETTRITAHAGCQADGSVCLYATGINEDDMRRVQEENILSSETPQSLSQTIRENLPIGLEIYDGQGKLTEINPTELRLMGVRNKSDVIGLDLFRNPKFQTI